jgi:hypothetical protein
MMFSACPSDPTSCIAWGLDAYRISPCVCGTCRNPLIFRLRSPYLKLVGGARLLSSTLGAMCNERGGRANVTPCLDMQGAPTKPLAADCASRQRRNGHYIFYSLDASLTIRARLSCGHDTCWQGRQEQPLASRAMCRKESSAAFTTARTR